MEHAAPERFAFFLDIDNTLMTDGVICQRNLDAIRRARALGSLVFINTARSFAVLPPQIDPVPLDGLVTALGCSIRVGGRQIVKATIPPERLAELIDLFNSRGVGMMIEGETALIANPFFPREAPFVVENGAEYLARFGTSEAGKAFCPCVLPEDLQKTLASEFTFFQHETYAEFGVKGHSKSTGIAAVLRETGIPLDHSCAMGDSLNDADMLRFCGISVAMGNAHKAIKEMCRIVTCPSAEGGVAEGIGAVLGIRT